MPRLRQSMMVLAALSLGLTPREADACSCGWSGMPADALAHATSVFEGTAESVSGDFDERRISFLVSRRWKGASTGSVEVRTSGQGPACGYRFEAGTRYLVYAHEHRGALHTSSCSRTKRADHVEMETRLLDAVAAARSVEASYEDLVRASREEPVPETRAEAIRLLAELRGPHLEKVARAALEDPEPVVRREFALHMQD